MTFKLRQLLRQEASHLSHRVTFENLRGDVLGGLTAAIVSLPLALTFGIASGAGAQAGLYGAILVGLGSALFGSSKTLISEPTGPMMVIMTTVVMDLVAAHGPERGLSMAFTVVILAGIFQIGFGLLRLGRYVSAMPYSVISGFMSGIGLLLILLQIPQLLGQHMQGGGAIGVLRALPELIRGAEATELIFGAGALVLLFALPVKWRRYLPPQLLVLVLGTLAATLFLAPDAIARIGQVPMGLPAISLPHFHPDEMTQIFIDALVLGMLGCIDALLTAMIADSLTREHHDSNRELIGQGVGNLLSGIFGGMPGAGATMGTVVSIQGGARTPLAALVRVAVLLAVIMAIAPLLESIPMVVLAAIAVKVGFDILDWSFLRRAPGISATATLIMWSVMVLTVLVDLVVAVGVGVFVANIITIERLSRISSSRVKVINTAGDGLELSDQEEALLAAARGQVIMLQLSGPMIFGVAQAIRREFESLKSAHSLIVDMTDVSMLNTTVALALENMIIEAHTGQHPVYIAGASGQVRDRLDKMKLFDYANILACESREKALTLAVQALPPQPPAPGPPLLIGPGE